MNLNEYSKQCHAANAKWWQNIETGEPLKRNKGEGMTLSKIRIFLEKCFEYGQAYVALSRARTLDGLFIESSRQGCIKAHPDALKFYFGDI